MTAADPLVRRAVLGLLRHAGRARFDTPRGSVAQADARTSATDYRDLLRHLTSAPFVTRRPKNATERKNE